MSKKITASPSPEVFQYHGLLIINRNKPSAGTSWTPTNKGRFSSHYGVSPFIISEMWKVISTDHNSNPLPPAAKYAHLLWSLLFLKVYATENVLAGIVGVDEKTFRKWSWLFVQRIAKLKLRFVSILVIFLEFVCFFIIKVLVDSPSFVDSVVEAI